MLATANILLNVRQMLAVANILANVGFGLWKLRCPLQTPTWTVQTPPPRGTTQYRCFVFQSVIALSINICVCHWYHNVIHMFLIISAFFFRSILSWRGSAFLFLLTCRKLLELQAGYGMDA